MASPTYYRAHPIETMDANINGLRNRLDHAVAQTAAGTPVRGSVLLLVGDLWRSGGRGDSHPRDLSGQCLVHRPRACYDESKRYGETLCVNFASSTGSR